uniref:Uncharacterized protein n=1 Tax=Rhizophora mucronata TaxID=61149 RepID=A0A2P2QA64_RHIMU
MRSFMHFLARKPIRFFRGRVFSQS